MPAVRESQLWRPVDTRKGSVDAPAFLPVFASVSATISSRTLLKS